MRIRRYEESDEIKEVISRAVESVEPEKYTEDEQEHLEEVILGMNLDFAEKNRYIYYVAIEEKEIIGVAGFQKESGTLAGIFTEPDHEGKGIGSRLLEKIEKKAKQEGIQEMESLASLEAIEFYKKNGYEIIDEKDQDIEGKKIPVKVMTKKI